MLLDAVCHLGKLGNEVDSVAIGQHENRPKAVSQLMAEPGLGIRDDSAAVDCHDQLREVTDIADETQCQIRWAPLLTAGRKVRPVVHPGDLHRARLQLSDVHDRTLGGGHPSFIRPAA